MPTKQTKDLNLESEMSPNTDIKEERSLEQKETCVVNLPEPSESKYRMTNDLAVRGEEKLIGVEN